MCLCFLTSAACRRLSVQGSLVHNEDVNLFKKSEICSQNSRANVPQAWRKEEYLLGLKC